MGRIIQTNEKTTYRIECYKCPTNGEYVHIKGTEFSPEDWNILITERNPGVTFLICESCRWEMFDADENPREPHGFRLGWQMGDYYLPQYTFSMSE